MMLPAVALLDVRPGRWWVPLPMPLILLWPPVLLILAVGGLVEAATGGGTLPRTRAVWLALWHLRGLQVEIERATGARVLLWLP